MVRQNSPLLQLPVLWRRHAQPLARGLYWLALAACLLLPLAAKRCYVDERSLLVGGATPVVRQSDAVQAALRSYLAALRANTTSTAALVEAAAAALPASQAGQLRLHRLNFTSPAGVPCTTLHTVVRPAGTDGSEGLALVLPLDAASHHAAALGAGVGLAAARFLQSAPWLARDVAVVFGDSACTPLENTEAWLGAYNSGSALFDFPRAGLLQQVLVLQVLSAQLARAELSVLGTQSQQPNLDLYALLKRNLDLYTGLPAGMHTNWQLPRALRMLGQAVSHAVGVAAPGSGALARYGEELGMAARVALQQAAELPSGAHAAFLRLHTDAVTLRLLGSPATSSSGKTRSGGSSSGRAADSPAPGPFEVQQSAGVALVAVETALRTCNNMQERLHHSSNLYLLLTPDRFAIVGAYLAIPGLLLSAAVAQCSAELQRALRAPDASWRAALPRAAAVHGGAWAGALLMHALQPRNLVGGCWRVKLLAALPWLGCIGAGVGAAALLPCMYEPPGKLEAADGDGPGASTPSGQRLEAAAAAAGGSAPDGPAPAATAAAGGAAAGGPADPPDGVGGRAEQQSAAASFLPPLSPLSAAAGTACCMRALGTVVLQLEGIYLLLPHWALGTLLLLATLPLYAASLPPAGQGAEGGTRARRLPVLSLAPAALLGWLCWDLCAQQGSVPLPLLLLGAQVLASWLSL